MRRTSIEAWRAVQESGLLQRLQLEIYDWLYEKGPLTAHEVASALQRQVNSANPRFCELQAMGVIETLGTRKCTITGRNALLWDVTDKEPVKVDKPLGKLAQVTQERDEWKREAIALRKEVTEANLKLNALRIKLSRWGRPSNKERNERMSPERLQEFTGIIKHLDVFLERERTTDQPIRATLDSAEGARAAGNDGALLCPTPTGQPDTANHPHGGADGVGVPATTGEQCA